MIREITERSGLDKALEKLPRSLFSGKISALARSYGFSYPFLRFYAAESCVIGSYYNSAVIAGTADAETALFCKTVGFAEILTETYPLPAGERLNIMKYAGKAGEIDAETVVNPPYERVFEIVREGFDADFDKWYTDTCHNVRHGVSTLFMLGDAAAECAFAENGIAFLTMIAVKKSARGKGAGSRLVKNISAAYARENEVFLICRDSLTGFYEKVGYIKTGNCFSIKL